MGQTAACPLGHSGRHCLTLFLVFSSVCAFFRFFIIIFCLLKKKKKKKEKKVNKHTRGTRVRHAWDTRATRVGHACDTRATRVGHACACTKFYVRARAYYAYYAYVIPLLISWASVIAKEAPFSSVYCYCNAMPAAAL